MNNLKALGFAVYLTNDILAFSSFKTSYNLGPTCTFFFSDNLCGYQAKAECKYLNNSFRTQHQRQLKSESTHHKPKNKGNKTWAGK